MLNRFFETLRGFTRSPVTNIVIGLILCITGGIEVVEGLLNEEHPLNIGARHGAVVFGFFHVLKFIPDLFEGAELIAYTDEEDK